MSDLGAIRTAILATASGVAGISRAYPRLPEAIAGTPAIVLGQMTWTSVPGQVADIDTYTFDLWLYVERLATDDQTISTADDFIGLILAAFSQGITLGNAGSTRSALIRGGRANEWVKIGGSEYMRVGFHLEVSARPARNRTA